MEVGRGQPEPRVSESSYQGTRDLSTRGASWLAKISGLAVGYSVYAAEKAGSLFTDAGRMSVQLLARPVDVRKVLLVKTSDLIQRKPAVRQADPLWQRLRRLSRDLSHLLKEKESQVLAPLHRKDAAEPDSAEVAGREVFADVPAPIEQKQPHEQQAPLEQQQPEDPQAWDGAPQPAPVLAGEAANTEETMVTQELGPAEQSEATPDPVLPEQPKPAREPRGVELFPRPRSKRVSMELASQKMAFIEVVRGVESTGFLTERTARRLRDIENPAVNELLMALAEHPHEATRVRSLDALTERQAQEAIPIFQLATADESARVRTAALSGLYRVGGEKAVPFLTRALKDDDPTVRHRAVTCLACLGTQDVAPKLLGLMKDTDASVRRAVISSLRTLKSATAVPRLIEALDDEDAQVREAAHKTLKELSHRNIMFNPQGSPEERAKAKARWKAWWREQRLSS
ncbi:MAG: HEAT repeat domain-containing protein [Candidatus Hydrogenedentes bacterium]|nr:HEAT repeat domain-containing protein [Candidatus Hydrogenedentota bacterium]